MHPNAVLDRCAELVGQALALDQPADATAAHFFREHRQLGPRERATLSDTLFAVLRRKLLFEHFARTGAGPKPRRLAILGFGGPAQYLDAALSAEERAWLALCRATPVDELPDHCRHNLPDWLARPLQHRLGDGFWALAHSLMEPASLDLRVNAMGARREDIRQELASAGIESVDTPHSPWGLRVEGKPSLAGHAAFRRGAVEIQDEGSQLLALLLDAKRGEMVADFCAGAGGKTLAIGAAMRDTGRLYAFDTSAHRLDALKPRLARSGLSNVHSAAIAHERDARIQRLAGKMDRVLVDAPCSGTGTLRRHPDLKWRQSQASVDSLSITQGAILRSAARLLKPGGRLVYATCSLLEQENEHVAGAFGDDHPDFRPVAVSDLLARLKVVPQDGTAALCSQAHGGADDLRLWPHCHATDGFFAAVWQKQK